MKRIAIASLLASTLISTPALADQTPWVPPQTDAYSDPQEVCEAQLNPNNPNSEFETEATNVSVGDPVNGPDIPDDDPYLQVGTGTPTFTGIVLGDDFHRNGGSPNIWVNGTAEQQIWPTSDLYYHTTHTVTTSTTFDCVPFKETGGGKIIDPDGLKSIGNVLAEVTEDVPGDDYIDHNGGPYVEPGTGIVLDNILICISPNNVTKGKPGTWTGKHGYLSSNCPYAAANVDSNWVPSGNAPDLP